MQMMKRLPLWLSALLLVALVAACAVPAAPASTGSESAATESTTAESSTGEVSRAARIAPEGHVHHGRSVGSRRAALCQVLGPVGALRVELGKL